MFDLDREVVRWCRRTYPWPHYRKSQVIELEDHLHCAVAKLVKEGLTPPEAFERAVTELGEAESLRTEYRKNWSRVSRAIRGVEGQPLPFCAALMIAGLFLVVLVVRNPESIQWTRNMLVAIYTMPFKFFGMAC